MPNAVTKAKAIRTFLELDAEKVPSTEFMVFYKSIDVAERVSMAMDSVALLNAAGADYELSVG